jgi:hypothetical protein
MPSNDNFGLSSAARSDWSSAWEAVSRLAATRESLNGADQPHHSPLMQSSANGQGPNGHGLGQNFAAASVQHIMALDHDQLASAVAEIEKASAMLRRSEPALEVGVPSSPARIEGRNYWSVWILIGAIWISATFVVASATGAILYLLG